MSTAGPSRVKRNAIPEEDARLLKFGSLADAEALTAPEVQAVLQSSRQQPGAPPLPDNKVFKSAQDHINEFSNMSFETAQAIRNALSVQALFNPFEIAQLMYLRPESVDVAVSLIPSLERLKETPDLETKLQDALDEVRNTARYGAQS